MVSGPNPAMARNVTREAPSERLGAGAQAIAAGGPAPLGATVGAGGVNFSVFAKRADRARGAAVRPRGCDGAGAGDSARRGAPSQLPLLARVRAGARAGAALCLPRARAVRPREGAPVRRRQGAPRSVWPRRRRAGRVLARRRQPAGRQQRHGDEERRGRSQELRLGRRRAASAAVGRNRHLRDARRRLHPARQLRCRAGEARHLCRPDREDSLPPGPRRDRGRAPAGVPVRSAPRAERRELLGLPADLVLRAASRVQLAAGSAGGARRVPRHGQGAAPRRHRGHPGRRVQPHRGRRAGRPDDLLQGPGQRHLLHPREGPLALRRLHGLRQHAERQPVDRAADDPRQPALLGDGDARRRLPLRPRVHPLARRERASPAEPADPVGHRIGSAAGRHEADRRGLGRRRALPGRQLRRRRLAGVERPVPRRRQELRPGRQRHRLRPGEQARGQSGRLRPQGARSRAQHQLRHLPRRLHRERRRLLQREAQRGQRRGQSRRRERQPELELRRRGADRRSGDRGAAQPADQEPPRDQSPVRRHADAHDGRRSPPHAGRQQQRLLPGQRHQLVRLGPPRASPRRPSLRPAPQRYRQRRDPASGSSTAEPHAAHRTGQDPVERRRSRPPRLERPLAHAGDHAGEPARPLPAARDLQRVLGAARLRAAAGADELSRLAALHRHGAGVARRHLPRRATRRRSAAPATWRSRGRSSCSRWGSTGGSDADRGRGEPDHRRRAQPRLHDRAARRVPRRVADDGRPVRDRRRTRPVSVVPARSAAFPGARRRVPGDGVRAARGSACSSTRRGWPAASSRAAGSVRA